MIARLESFIDRFLPKGSALRHVSLVAGGTTIAQGIGIITMPLLSRIYSPADFGVMAVFVSVTSILVEISGLRYHFAIPLPKQERYADALIVLSFLLQALFVVIISLVLLVFGKTILSKFSMDVLMPYQFLIPIGVLGMGTYLILTYWAIRKKLFSTIGRTRVTQSLSGALTKIALGFFGFKPIGLLLGSIVSQAGGISTLSFGLVRGKGFPKPVRPDIKRVAIRYRKFPMYDAWTGMLNTVGRQIMPMLLVSFYSPHVAGLFSMAHSLLSLPSAFIGQAIGQVFLQRASVARHQGNLKDLSMRTYIILLRLGLFPILLLAFFAPSLFAYVLGERWLEAGSFARVLGPWIAFSFAYSPMSNLYSILNRQAAGLVFEIFYISARVLAFWAGTTFGGPLLAAALFGLVGFTVLFFRMNYILSAAGNDMRHILKANMSIFLETGLLLVLPIAFVLFKLHPVIIGVALLLSLGAYSKRALTSFKIAGGRI